MNQQETYKWMVCVHCATYNHAPYIKDAFDGFSKQETTFPFVCVVVDDASSDGEQMVIKEYLEDDFNIVDDSVFGEKETDAYWLTIAQHKSNKNCYFAFYQLKYNHGSKKSRGPYYLAWDNNSKYVARCEGDDYWTNPNKLQKQFVFLESHPDFTLCFHKAKVIVESGDYRSHDNDMYNDLQEREYSGIELAKKWQVPTASMFYRVNIRPPKDKNLLTGDIPLVLQCAIQGRVFCMEEEMSVYRRTSGGASLRQYSTLQTVDKILAYIQYFPPFKSVYQNNLITLMGGMIYSPHLFSAIKLVSQRRQLLRYFVAGIFKGGLLLPVRIYNKLFGNKNQ